MKFKPGDIVPATTLESVTGEPIMLPDPNRLVHLQFRRFVDCLSATLTLPSCAGGLARSKRRASKR
jgi:hypothetical protein